MPQKLSKDDQEALNTANGHFNEAERFHATYRDKFDRWYKAYEGILEASSIASDWRAKQHPAYVNDTIESAVANIVEARVRFQVKARPRDTDPDEVQLAIAAARAYERLLAYQVDRDGLQKKQRLFILQDLICGMTVAKTYWVTESRDVPVREMVREEPALDDYGYPVGEPAFKPVTFRENRVMRDDPTFEVVDVRDFLWPETATCVEKAPWLIHRVWMSKDDIARNPLYRHAADDVQASDRSGVMASREADLWNIDRTRGLVEVLEHWTDEHVTTFTRDGVLLAHRENPFWHGEKPFVVACGTSRLFQIPGISEVYKLAEIQEMIWALMNQRLDNVRFVNNAIAMIASDVMDPDEYEFFPGARWMMDRPDQVQMWSPDIRVAEVSLNAEAILKGDLQNVSGGLPFLSGANSDTVDQSTATGVSIVTSLAQRRIVARKQAYWTGFDEAANQWAWLNRQYVTRPKLIAIAGKGAAETFEQIDPELLRPDVLVSSEPMTESLMRQERRAEAQALLQTAAQVATVFAAAQSHLNMRAFMEDYLEAFDVDDKDRYFMAPQSAGPVPGVGTFPAEGGQPGLQQPGGVTGPQAFDASSPSNANSMSGEQFMQRALTMAGPQGGPQTG